MYLDIRRTCVYCGNPLSIIEYDGKVYATCFTPRCPMENKTIVYEEKIL